MKKRSPRPTDSQLAALCRQLALLLRAGVGSEEGAALLLEETEPGPLHSALSAAHQALEKGDSLTQALEGTGVFPPYLLQMTDMGERTGRLEQVLFALADFYDRQAQAARTLRRAAAYPAGMALLVLVLFGTLVSQVLPVFRRVFEQLGATPSAATQAVLALGDGAQAAAWVLAAVLVLGVILALVCFRTRGGRQAARRLFARTRAGRALDRSRFAAAMSLMLSSGLPLEEAAGRAAGLLEGAGLAGQARQCHRQIQEGALFHRAVEEAGLFSRLQLGLLAAGSRAGAADQAMEELAGRCAAEAEERLESLLNRFEYALVAFLCLSIGLVLLSVMLPLVGMLSAVGG